MGHTSHHVTYMKLIRHLQITYRVNMVYEKREYYLNGNR
jgi:hypothetical protein